MFGVCQKGRQQVVERSSVGNSLPAIETDSHSHNSKIDFCCRQFPTQPIILHPLRIY